MSSNKKAGLIGFEDFEVINLYSGFLTYTEFPYWGYSNRWESYIIPIGTIQKNGYTVANFSKYATNHTELLPTAKTVYIHPSCKLSRAAITQKYKKVLNPWMADVVVIPDVRDEISAYSHTSIFINESVKIVVYMDYIDKKFYNTFENLPKGTKIRDLVLFDTSKEYTPDIENVLNAEFDYYGSTAVVSKSESYLADLVQGTLPLNKIVYESSIMKTLGNEENKPTFEQLVSIHEMLGSTDKEVVASAITALASMDYINYPNAIRTVFYEAKDSGYSGWRYNKATNSTAAKYMFQQLFNGTARRNRGIYSEYISEEDYALTEKLIRYFYACVNDDIKYNEYVKGLNFMYTDATMIPKPRIKN